MVSMVALTPTPISLDYDYSTLKGGSSGIDVGDIHLMERLSDSNSGEVFILLHILPITILM